MASEDAEEGFTEGWLRSRNQEGVLMSRTRNNLELSVGTTDMSTPAPAHIVSTTQAKMSTALQNPHVTTPQCKGGADEPIKEAVRSCVWVCGKPATADGRSNAQLQRSDT